MQTMQTMQTMHIARSCILALLLTFNGTSYANSPDADTSSDAHNSEISDSSDADSGPCGGISHAGCCANNTVFYCEGEEVKSMNCSNRRGVYTLCGWRASDQIYDCGTEGFAAPDNDPAFLCAGEEETCVADCEGKTCGPDGCGASCGSCPAGEQCKDQEGICESLLGCGEIGSAGCCEGGTLRYCGGSVANPQIQEKDCAASGLSCGWSTEGSWYDCGTGTDEDPSGNFPRTCPDGPPQCVPDCEGKNCGDDGCWGSCGSCSEAEECSDQQICMSIPTEDSSSSKIEDVQEDTATRRADLNPSRQIQPEVLETAAPETKKVIRRSCSTTPQGQKGPASIPALTLLTLGFLLRHSHRTKALRS